MNYQHDRITENQVHSACMSVADKGNVQHLHRDHGQDRRTVAIRYGDFGQEVDVYCLDTNAIDHDKPFYSDDAWIIVEQAMAFLNNEPLRYGAVVVFPSNYTRKQAEDALAEIHKHIDANYYVSHRWSLIRDIVHGFDGRHGGPVWYIP